MPFHMASKTPNLSSASHCHLQTSPGPQLLNPLFPQALPGTSEHSASSLEASLWAPTPQTSLSPPTSNSKLPFDFPHQTTNLPHSNSPKKSSTFFGHSSSNPKLLLNIPDQIQKSLQLLLRNPLNFPAGTSLQAWDAEGSTSQLIRGRCQAFYFPSIPGQCMILRRPVSHPT